MISCVVLMALSQLTPGRPAASPTAEPSRIAGEYFVQRSGASWSYVGPGNTKARYAITKFVDWRASFTFSAGRRSAGGTWRVKEGTWLERGGGRGDVEAIVLPATMTRGTRWVTLASLERGTAGQSQYEVLSIDAEVELPNGRVDHCLAVLETLADGSAPLTHYYAPNMGKVAVRGPDDWLFRLTSFQSGARDHDVD